jgi:hypothetical protein
MVLLHNDLVEELLQSASNMTHLDKMLIRIHIQTYHQQKYWVEKNS